MDKKDLFKELKEAGADVNKKMTIEELEEIKKTFVPAPPIKDQENVNSDAAAGEDNNEEKEFVILLKEGLEYDVQEKDVEALLSQGFSKK